MFPIRKYARVYGVGNSGRRTETSRRHSLGRSGFSKGYLEEVICAANLPQKAWDWLDLQHLDTSGTAYMSVALRRLQMLGGDCTR